jgi:hypothetical protein
VGICKMNPPTFLESFFNQKEEKKNLNELILVPAKLGNDQMASPLP